MIKSLRYWLDIFSYSVKSAPDIESVSNPSLWVLREKIPLQKSNHYALPINGPVMVRIRITLGDDSMSMSVGKYLSHIN